MPIATNHFELPLMKNREAKNPPHAASSTGLDRSTVPIKGTPVLKDGSENDEVEGVGAVTVCVVVESAIDLKHHR